MASKIVSIETNPQYPSRNITSDSADILSLMLQNQTVAEDAHLSAENSVPFYTRTHQAVGMLARRLSRDDIARGMHVGATTFEAISTMVRPVPPSLKRPESLSIYQSYFVKGGILRTIELLEEAKFSIESNCPNISQVIREVALRQDKSIADSALMAAGISRNIELDILNVA